MLEEGSGLPRVLRKRWVPSPYVIPSALRMNNKREINFGASQLRSLTVRAISLTIHLKYSAPLTASLTFADVEGEFFASPEYCALTNRGPEKAK